MERNPLQDICRKREKGKKKNARREPLEESEIVSFLNAIQENTFCPSASRFKHSHYYPFLKFIFSTGVRNAEAIGIRVKHINFADRCIEIGEVKALEEVINDEKGYRKLCTWLKKFKLEIEQLLVVMEYTGIYTYGVERYLHKERIAFVKRPALDIKRSLGMIRGKTDRADAKFISRYGWMRKDELKPMKPVEQNLVILQNLMTYRDKMVVDRASYQVRIKELQGQMGDALHNAVIDSTEEIMKMLSREIKNIEKNIFENVRKLICYCGVAPFKHESGTGIRGRTRVSPLANKKLKTLLTMAAICTVRFDSGLKTKYHQKVGEGKPKMSVLNIIRAKLIERIFTVVKRGSPFRFLGHHHCVAIR